MTDKKIPIWEKLNLTVVEASEYSGIGVNKMREIAQRPDCTFSIRNGSHILIKRKEFEKWNATVREIS